jgi:AbrB family looped-hinge helix DNA binding protein
MSAGKEGEYPFREERVRMSDGGRVVIPLQIREAMGVKSGDELVVRLDDKTLRVCSLDEALRQAQAIVRRYVEPGRSLSAELIQDRRRESERE